MSENSYEEYKKNFSRDQKKHSDLHRGKVLILLGPAFLLYLLWILPFHVANVSEIHGDEVKAGKQYYPVKVYYIEKLQILRTRKNADDDKIYCIAKFLDCDQNEWIISFTPGRNERLAEQIRLSTRFEDELSLTTSGYFQMQYLEDLPFAADSFYSVYGSKYADAEGRNMLSLNAEYLCDKNDNYMQQVLLHPGIPLGSLVAGLVATAIGAFLLIKNRKRQEA